ncbi:MAG: BrnT family toxin [Planctomycetota bacterium]
MEYRFTWNEAKSASNLRKHGVSFLEASEVFSDPRVLFEYDEEHSEYEDRFHAIGLSNNLRMLLVVHTEPSENAVRIISARPATPTERQRYERNPRR